MSGYVGYFIGGPLDLTKKAMPQCDRLMYTFVIPVYTQAEAEGTVHISATERHFYVAQPPLRGPRTADSRKVIVYFYDGMELNRA